VDLTCDADEGVAAAELKADSVCCNGKLQIFWFVV